MIVGLTGGIGSGKTTVLNLFKTFEKVAVYIADIEAKNLMNSSATIKEKIIAEFGSSAYGPEGLNRNYLSDIIFSNKKKLTLLNEIVHPEVHKHFQKFVAAHANYSYIIYESAILFENNSERSCDVIITVVADKQLRIDWVIDRDSTLKEVVLNRMANQWGDTKKAMQSNYMILNNNLTETKLQVERIHNNLTKNHY